MSALLRNLLRFSSVLRALGVPVPAGGTIDVADALQHVDIRRRSDFYFTLRALLVQRQVDLAIFDEAFRTFWRKPAAEWSAKDLRAMGEQRRIGPPEPAQAPRHAGGGSAGDREERITRVLPFSYSASGVSRTKDFAKFNEAEMAQAKAMLDTLEWTPGERRTRRWKPGPRGSLDVRRLVRSNARHGLEPLILPRRRRRVKERPLVLICDVSGSMERYSRMLLHFVHSLSSRRQRVEAFLFATQLTRITADLAHRGADDAVRRVLRSMSDWGGGTRIGDSLRTFNVTWARRVTGRGPVVLLISDGWDRGEPDDLSREIARLHRSCHRLIWLNPLLGSSGYQPLTRGMQAALPFVDDFLPVHNLASLESLAVHLNALPSRQSRRPRYALARA